MSGNTYEEIELIRKYNKQLQELLDNPDDSVIWYLEVRKVVMRMFWVFNAKEG